MVFVSDIVACSLSERQLTAAGLSGICTPFPLSRASFAERTNHFAAAKLLLLFYNSSLNPENLYLKFKNLSLYFLPMRGLYPTKAALSA
jgi:hypothetical protein